MAPGQPPASASRLFPQANTFVSHPLLRSESALSNRGMLSLKSCSPLFILCFIRFERRYSLLNKVSLRPSRSTDCYWRCNASTYAGPPLPGQVGLVNEENEDAKEKQDPPKVSKNGQPSRWGPTLFKMFESAATTCVSLMVLG